MNRVDDSTPGIEASQDHDNKEKREERKGKREERREKRECEEKVRSLRKKREDNRGQARPG